MTCHEYDAEIGDYVDGTLAPGRVAALDAHLSICADCRAMVADFRTLRAAAASLERRTPPAHVWTRVAAEVHSQPPPRMGWAAWVPAGMTWRSALAAGVLVAVLAGGAWFSWREVSDPRPAQSALVTPRTGDSAPDDAQVQGATQVIRTQISHLQQIVTAESAVLPGETKAVFAAANNEIDNAIGGPTAVLDQEPSNELAQQSLFEALRSKLALLQEMIALINEMRQGNQDEAARIVSGMEP